MNRAWFLCVSSRQQLVSQTRGTSMTARGTGFLTVAPNSVGHVFNLTLCATRYPPFLENHLRSEHLRRDIPTKKQDIMLFLYSDAVFESYFWRHHTQTSEVQARTFS